MKQLFIATANQHKCQEFKAMLEPLGYQVLSLRDLKEPIEIDETGTTFAENAIIKAQTICDLIQKPVISDDSGLEVDALNKEPGIYSARYMGHDTPHSIKNRSIIERVQSAEDRSCRFVCAMALARPNHEPIVFEDTLEGQVASEPLGEHGFGYDPIVYLPQYGTTVACLSEEEKNKISHRGKALRKLVEFLQHEEIL